jgi:protein-S-isoprenylcysteine O-methyltransferase Ste14
MSIEYLRLFAFCAYLAAWVVFAIGALVIVISVTRRHTASPFVFVNAPVLIGALMQTASPLAITAGLGGAALRPRSFELLGVCVLAPFAAALFIAVIFSMLRDDEQQIVMTRGVYAWIRHPLYLAFLAMLVSTGLLAPPGLGTVVSIITYLAGSELRIAAEEQELSNSFQAVYAEYRLRTRWRYLPGVR